MIPREAWKYLLGRARERDPRCLLLAEAYPNYGPGYPTNDPDQLIDAGFDAVYSSGTYDALKRIYLRNGTSDDYDRVVTSLLPRERTARAGLSGKSRRAAYRFADCVGHLVGRLGLRFAGGRLSTRRAAISVWQRTGSVLQRTGSG